MKEIKNVVHDPAEKIRVIIVEPETVVALTLKMILDAEGFAVKTFTDSVQGLRAVLSESPQVVISAVMMPQVNGIELAIEAKRNCPDCRVILWSAVPEAVVLQQEALAHGHAFEILPKPVSPTALLERIRKGSSVEQPALIR